MKINGYCDVCGKSYSDPSDALDLNPYYRTSGINDLCSSCISRIDRLLDKMVDRERARRKAAIRIHLQRQRKRFAPDRFVKQYFAAIFKIAASLW